MRPIDADVLYQKTEELEKQAREASRQAITEPTQEKWNNILAERSAFKYDITQMPTIDAVPVVHGEWDCNAGLPTCTVCGKMPREFYIDGSEKWPFCPNCGAKMDGGKDDDSKE